MTDEYNPDIESRSDYYDRISMSADVIEEYLQDDPTTEVAELVFEEADSSRVAIYTHEALSALRFSGNEPEEWSQLVTDGSSWQEVVSAMAFDVYRIDLWEELRRREIVD